MFGSEFLKATETLSKYRHRLVNCRFSVFSGFHLNFLDGGRQVLKGKVGKYPVFAVPDTGAERNVMDLEYGPITVPSLKKKLFGGGGLFDLIITQ